MSWWSSLSHLLLTASVLVVTGAAPTAALAQSEPGPDTLVVYGTGDTDGKFARPRCRQTPILTNDRMAFARQAGYYRRFARRESADRSTFRPVALHLGDAIFPGPLGRFLLQSGESGGTMLARILRRIPFESVTMGNREMGMTRTELLSFVEGVMSLGVPLRGANIRCRAEGGADILCDALRTHARPTTTLSGSHNADHGSPSNRYWRPYDLVKRHGVRILLVSMLDPAIRSSVALSRMNGLEILDPTAVLTRKLPDYRRQTDPDLVFVQYHASSSSDVDSLVAMARQVEGIDAMFTNKQLGGFEPPSTVQSSGYVRVPKTGTYIIPTGRSPSHASLTELHLSHRTTGRGEFDDHWSIRRLETRQVDTSSGPVDPGTAELLWEASRDLCREWGESIRKTAPLEHSFDYEAFQTFVLNVMRFSVEAEVALANEGAFLRADNFPIRQHLTHADLYTILPYHNPLVTVRLEGRTLQQLAYRLDGEAVAEGLSIGPDGQPLVNGRPIRPDRSYTVATNQYVAEGGDELVSAETIDQLATYEPSWSGEPPAIADIVIHFVKSGQFALMGPVDDRISPSGNFPNLHRRLLWDLVGSMNLSYNQVAVRNPGTADNPVYEQSQLNVQPTAQINLEGSFQANADSQNHGWDNSLLVQYATAQVNGRDQRRFQETRDLIRGKTRYKYAGFRSRLGGGWWVPMPTGELQAETEFGPPDARAWHKFEVTGILGSTFQLFEPFELRVGLDLRRDLNSPAAETVWGLTAGYTLSRIDLAELSGRPLRFESEVEYFFNNPYTTRIHELRHTTRIFYSIFDQLNLTSTFSTFMYRTAAVGKFGRNTEFTIGVNYLWDEAVQAF